MSRTVRAVEGLFDWLKVDEAGNAPIPVNDTTSPEDRVVALRKELFEAAQAQMDGAQNAQKMIALLDALRVAEQKPDTAISQPVTQEPAAQADDFGAEPAETAVMQETESSDHSTAIPTWQNFEAYEAPLRRDVPANGWLIDALHGDEAKTTESQPGKTVFSEGSVLEGRWTVEAHALPKAESSLVETIAETDATAPDNGSGNVARFIDVPVGPTLAQRTATFVGPMIRAYNSGMIHARKTMATGVRRINEIIAQQREAAKSRAETREAARQQAAAAALEQLAQNRAEAAQAELARMQAVRLAAEAPLPLAAINDFALPQAPDPSANEYSHEAVEALLSIPETRWSGQNSVPVQNSSAPVSTFGAEDTALPEWLEEKLALHGRWLESGGTQGKRYRYNGEDFSGISLSGQCLVQAQMRGASFAGIDLSGAQLDGGDFSEADFSRAILADARAARAVFARANFTFADMNGMQAPGATFNFADLQGAKMKEAWFDHVQMREANLQGVVAPEVRMQGANLRGVRLFESILPGADLRGADLRGAHMERTIFIGTLLEGASLKDAKIHDLDYAQTDFTVALDVPQEVQLAALSAERAKLNEARATLESRFTTMQLRESRMLANLRVLEHKRHYDGQFDAQETAVVQKLEAHVRWLRRSSFWWLGMVALLFGAAGLAMSEMPMASINFPVLGLIASFGVVSVALSLLSLLRIWRVRSSLGQLLKHRSAARSAIAEQAVQEAAGV